MGYAVSSRPRSLRRSLRLACLMAIAITGAATFENPAGSPRFLSVIRVALSSMGCQV